MRALLFMVVVVGTMAAGCGKDDKPTTTPTSTGACCSPSAACIVTTQATCSGTWIPTDVCDPNPCPQPPAMGSCCTPEQLCTVTTRTSCPGIWNAAGNCDPNPCSAPPPAGMVLILPGSFTMGSPASELGRGDDETQHRVTLTRSFYMCDHEVTQTEWRAVMGWNDSYFQGPNRPVEQVTWFDCLRYCNLRSAGEGLDSVYAMTSISYQGVHIESATVAPPIWNHNGYRLPTEAEWEFACRAGSTTAFCNGPVASDSWLCPGEPSLDLVGWYTCTASEATHDVKRKQPNAWGLYDMHGNVEEWCWDLWAADYGAGSATDPTGATTGESHTYRGGFWGGFSTHCRSAAREWALPYTTVYAGGLRLARTPPSRHSPSTIRRRPDAGPAPTLIRRR